MRRRWREGGEGGGGGEPMAAASRWRRRRRFQNYIRDLKLAKLRRLAAERGLELQIGGKRLGPR